MMPNKPMAPHLVELIAKAKAAHAARVAAVAASVPASVVPQGGLPVNNAQAQDIAYSGVKPAASPATLVNTNHVGNGLQNSPHFRTSSALEYNKEQSAAIEYGIMGKSFCLIGAAGTGKTTTTREIISQVQRANHCLPFPDSSKMLNKGQAGIVICGYTNKAVNNIRKGLPTHLQPHCMTIHKLIEFGPVWYEDGDGKNKMRFEPLRNGANKLPHISVLIVEEASMVGIDLWAMLVAALPNPRATQVIMLGDLNQIPPVFGPSILGFKLAEQPTIELTHVYRQALLSPIIQLATDVRTNNSFKLPALLKEVTTHDNGEHGKLTIHPWKRRVDNMSAVAFMRSFLPKMIENGTYDPEEDQILCPFNKSFGTLELNKIIADYLGKKRGAIVYEVIARYQASYWAVGDLVLFDRHEARIVDIKPTPGYFAKVPQPASATLDRWGKDPNGEPVVQLTALELLNKLETADKSEDSANLASHTIRVYIPDLDVYENLDNAGQINSLIFKYALTIHKSQGSEWRKVFLFLHNSHSTMMSRELLYTGITRAKHELYIICEGDNAGKPNTIIAASKRPVIPGTTLVEKIGYFSNLAKQMMSKARAKGANGDDDSDF